MINDITTTDNNTPTTKVIYGDKSLTRSLAFAVMSVTKLAGNVIIDNIS